MFSYSSWFLYVNCFALDFGALPHTLEREYFIWTYISFLKEAHNTCPKLKCFHLNTLYSSETISQSPSAEGMGVELVRNVLPALSFCHKLRGCR